MKFCEYGCGREAKHFLSNGKLCCEEKWQSCPSIKEKAKKTREGKKITSINFEDYKKWREAVLEKDGNKCQLCDERKDLETIRLYPIDKFPHLALDPEYGVTLCKKHINNPNNKV